MTDMFIVFALGVLLTGGAWWLIATVIRRAEVRDLERDQNRMRADLAREALLQTRAHVDASERARARVAHLPTVRERNAGVEHRPRSYAKGFKR